MHLSSEAYYRIKTRTYLCSISLVHAPVSRVDKQRLRVVERERHHPQAEHIRSGAALSTQGILCNEEKAINLSIDCKTKSPQLTRGQEVKVRVSFRWHVVAVLGEGPRRRLVGRRRVGDAEVEPEDLPGALVIQHDALWGEVAVEHLDAVVQEVQPFAQLHQSVLNLHVEELVLADVLRNRLGHVLGAAEHVGQAAVDRLGGERQAVPALLQRVLDGQNLRIEETIDDIIVTAQIEETQLEFGEQLL